MSARLKDFSSVSPSAKSLGMMKGYTDIPHAREMAALMHGAEVFDLDFADKDFWFWIRVMHFENRYRSIDQLLKETDGQRVLELSSGYSLRGLALCEDRDSVHYIDTDLPEVVAIKQDMIRQLKLEEGMKGKLELLPLNVLDPSAFNELADRFEPGPITIVNEGLLMYLNVEEKIALCRTIRSVLQRRGGCWITADVYVKRSPEMGASLPQSAGEVSFLEQHRVEENKFDSYEAARTFFAQQGFEVMREAEPDYAGLSVMPHLLKALPEAVRNSKEPPPKIQTSWMLRAMVD